MKYLLAFAILFSAQTLLATAQGPSTYTMSSDQQEALQTSNFCSMVSGGSDKTRCPLIRVEVRGKTYTQSIRLGNPSLTTAPND